MHDTMPAPYEPAEPTTLREVRDVCLGYSENLRFALDSGAATPPDPTPLTKLVLPSSALLRPHVGVDPMGFPDVRVFMEPPEANPPLPIPKNPYPFSGWTFGYMRFAETMGLGFRLNNDGDGRYYPALGSELNLSMGRIIKDAHAGTKVQFIGDFRQHYETNLKGVGTPDMTKPTGATFRDRMDLITFLTTFPGFDAAAVGMTRARALEHLWDMLVLADRACERWYGIKAPWAPPVFTE